MLSSKIVPLCALYHTGCKPLCAMTEALFLAGARIILHHGAHPNLNNHNQDKTSFGASLAEGKHLFPLLYLENGALVDTYLSSGNTPLIEAIRLTSDGGIVGQMLEKGADPNKKNTRGETALFAAISNGHTGHIASLLSHNAKPNLPGRKHILWPAVHQAHTLELLLQGGGSANIDLAPGLLELATSIDSVEAVDILLEYGADPNVKKDGIYTPLCTAIRDGREAIVDLLLSASADPDLAAVDRPIVKWVTYGRSRLLSELSDAGADLNCSKGIVEACVGIQERECLEILLQKGADVNERDPSGSTALTRAIMRIGDVANKVTLNSNRHL